MAPTWTKRQQYWYDFFSLVGALLGVVVFMTFLFGGAFLAIALIVALL